MPRKDLENVLRNLYCFLEILQNSRSEEVSSWDKQSLDNALKWADFAEQVKEAVGEISDLPALLFGLSAHFLTLRITSWTIAV